jgi:hypothetical protein
MRVAPDELAELLAGQVEVIGPVRPGDMLIFRLPVMSPTAHDEFVARIPAAMDAKLPGVGKVYLSGIDQILAYRPATPD